VSGIVIELSAIFVEIIIFLSGLKLKICCCSSLNIIIFKKCIKKIFLLKPSNNFIVLKNTQKLPNAIDIFLLIVKTLDYVFPNKF